MRTVTLEILRNGPANNQLLSPLTQYLVLCGNMPASTLTLPFAHQEFLLRMQNLQYKESGESRSLEVAETSRRMSEVLATIPGLIRELKDAESSSGEIIHLRLVLSPNELALLPFELSLAPPGWPGAGEPLLLQTQTPISLTREVRRVSSQEVSPVAADDTPVRILFAAASPAGFGSVPLRAHLLALRRAIGPWLWASTSEEERRREIAKRLTVLPEASIKQIEEACATGSYTHVHVLAHGVEIPRPEGSRFALALHDSTNPVERDLVEGDRLAIALRAHVERRDADFARPRVVTLAACNAGDVGSVVGAAASIAHDLHQEGIPFVVASQFPLSFAGSVVMADVLYRELLWGADPRLALIELRRSLRTGVANTHDWGSVVGYVSLPASLEEQLCRFRLRRAYDALVAAVNHFDRALELRSRDWPDTHEKGKNSTDEPEAEEGRLREIGRDGLREARARLQIFLKTMPSDRSIYGLFGSAEKRLAETLWRLNYADGLAEVDPEIELSLRQSRSHYLRAFEADPTQSWGLVQALALETVLEPLGKRWREDCRFARVLSQRSLEDDNREHRAWAHSSILELDILALATPIPEFAQSWEDSLNSARKHAELLLEEAVTLRWEVHSTQRQLVRYEFFDAWNRERKYLCSLTTSVNLAKTIWRELRKTL